MNCLCGCKRPTNGRSKWHDHPACYKRWLKDQAIPEDIYTCKACKEPFQRYKTTGRPRITCSKACANTARADNGRKKGKPNKRQARLRKKAFETTGDYSLEDELRDRAERVKNGEQIANWEATA